MRFTSKRYRVIKREQKTSVLLSYSVWTMGCKQPKKCQLYPLFKNITFFLIVSKAIRDIENIIAASDNFVKFYNFVYEYLL